MENVRMLLLQKEQSWGLGKLTSARLLLLHSIPVIAAGGIGDRRCCSYFMLGRRGCSGWNCFVAQKESNAHPEIIRRKILKARDIDTTISAQHFGHVARLKIS